MPWRDPSLTLRWGAYTKMDGDEQQKVVAMVVQAKDSGICTERQAIEKVAGIFGTENVDAVLEALEEERTKKAEDALKQQTTLEHAMSKIANGSEAPAGGKGSADEAPSGGDAATAGA